MHAKAHDGTIREKRNEIVITRGMQVSSGELGISGECDVVEFHRSQDGIYIPRMGEKYAVVPVEYKRGMPKENDCDELQLCAQALCLEEMLCCVIEKGYLYYGESRRRHIVTIDKALREKTKDMIYEMHEIYGRQHTPKVKRTKACNACSLKDVCLPVLNRNRSAGDYIKEALDGD